MYHHEPETYVSIDITRPGTHYVSKTRAPYASPIEHEAYMRQFYAVEVTQPHLIDTHPTKQPACDWATENGFTIACYLRDGSGDMGVVADRQGTRFIIIEGWQRVLMTRCPSPQPKEGAQA